MTTEAAARWYLAQHLMEVHGRPVAVFNPKGLPLEELPPIYAYSNVVGGVDGICYAMADDGHVLGSHWCSCEGYAPNDLGVLEGCRDDRHEDYRKHYPDGYRMEFVPSAQVKDHPGLMAAYARNQQLAEQRASESEESVTTSEK